MNRRLTILILAAPLLLAAGYSATTLVHTHQSATEGGTLDVAALSTGTLPIARGGTNGTATPTLGAVAYGTGSALAWSGAPGATGDCLKGDTTGAPTWGSCAAGGGYATVQDETTPLTQRTTINFTGAGVSCVDNGGTSTTDCTIAGGGGSPGGSTTQVQYNNGGAFGGAANVKIVSDNLTIAAVSTPATPAAANMVLYGKARAGRVIPATISPDGVQHTIQEALFSNSVQIMQPNTGTTVPTAFGNTWTGRASTGTLSHPAIATTNHLTLMRQSLYTSGAVAGQGYGIQGTFAMNYLGNAANRGGFFFFARFGFTAYSSAARVFVGLTTQNAAFGATEPSTVNNTVGLCKDSTDTGFVFCTRNGATTTKSAAYTGVATGRIYDFTMSAPPNSTTVTYRLVDETNDTVIWDNVATSTTTPTVNTLMYPWTWVGASSAVSQIMAVGKVYVASDY